MQAFLCFQINHAHMTTSELNPFLLFFGARLLVFLHHSAKFCSFKLGTPCWRPSGERTQNKNSHAKIQEVSRCWMVLSAWSQSGHWLGWGKFCFTKWSAIQHLSRTASHKKTLYSGGAQVFQIWRQGSKLIDPWKKARHAYFVVKTPELSNLQLWESSFGERMKS